MATKALVELERNAKHAAELLKALAHEIRLMAVCAIGEDELNVQQLEARLGCSQANVSQHLGKLRAMGILEGRREGNQVFYSVKNARILQLVRVLQKEYC